MQSFIIVCSIYTTSTSHLSWSSPQLPHQHYSDSPNQLPSLTSRPLYMLFSPQKALIPSYLVNSLYYLQSVGPGLYVLMTECIDLIITLLVCLLHWNASRVRCISFAIIFLPSSTVSSPWQDSWCFWRKEKTVRRVEGSREIERKKKKF